MKQEEPIINKYGKDSGMRVPEGYFPDLKENILRNLPPYPIAQEVVERSRWNRIKPYVYLAAMFCGIWLMMKVFHTATQPISMGLENPPEAIVELLDGGMEYEFQYLPYANDFDPEEDELIMSYDNIEDFEKDFYAQI